MRSCPLHTEAAGAAPPDAFGPFRVLHQIGAGALGPVFRAFDADGARLVAIKLFRLNLPPERVHQFVAELERLISLDLNHPSLVAPIATGTDGLVAYLAQEFVPSESLDIALRDRGPVDPADALRLVTRVAEALDFAAARGVLHGTLHSRDILATDDQVRVTGLGIADALERIGGLTPVRLPYSAPERIGGRSWDRRADVFALAALTHDVLWGRRVLGLGAAAAQALMPLASADARALRTVFARALAESPEERFETALDFTAALSDAFPGVVARDASAATVSVPAPIAIETVVVDEAEEDAAALDLFAAETSAEPAISVLSIPESAPLTVNSDYQESTDTLPGDDEGRFLIPDVQDPPPPVHDYELVAAERERYDEVEVRPTAAEEEVASEPITPMFSSLDLGETPRPDPSPRRTETFQPYVFRSRPSKWPVAAALIIGLGLGLGGGYFVGRLDRAVSVLDPRSGGSGPALSPSTAPAPRGTTGPGVASRETATRQQDPARQAGLDTTKPLAATGEVPKGKPERAVTPPARLERKLVVQSTPADAIVFVDGRQSGRTPATIRDVSSGTHRLRIVRAGYIAENRRVVVTDARPTASIGVTLEREPANAVASLQESRAPGTSGTLTGALDVDSRPMGARVFVDERLVGTTPVNLADVSSGEHVVRLEYDGFRGWKSTVRIQGGQRNRVTASLDQ